jgi:Putative bacterial sensory transduction regulator
VSHLDELIAGVLDCAGLEYEHPETGRFIVTLPGSARLQTTCLVLVGRHGVLVEAFVCRHPDEAHEDVYRWLLQRNTRLYGVHYALDKAGDIYLIGRMARHATTADELDRVLGQVVEAADGDFNTLLELGFAASIRREWNWRVARGESLRNLAAFEHLVR